MHDLLRQANHFVVVHAGQRLGPQQALVAEIGVASHFVVLLRGERAGLAQHRVGYADLADVVKRRERGDQIDASLVVRLERGERASAVASLRV